MKGVMKYGSPEQFKKKYGLKMNLNGVKLLLLQVVFRLFFFNKTID